MIKRNNAIRFLMLSVGALIVVTAFNVTADIGAFAHDMFCPEHGWLT